MTLVAAAVQEETIALVADTKLTFDEDPISTASLFNNAFLKLVLLRDNLALGVAGEFPERVVKDVMPYRQSDIPALLDYLRAEGRGDFVVAALDPLELWSVKGGTIERRELSEGAWVGDNAAYSRLRRLASDWPEDTDVVFRLQSSMQNLTSSLGSFPSVGGFPILAMNTSEGFRYKRDSLMLFQPADSANVQGNGGQVSIRASFDVTAGPAYRSIEILPGEAKTPGALGIFERGASAGLLFLHDQPFESTKILAASPAEFAGIACAEHGQSLQL